LPVKSVNRSLRICLIIKFGDELTDAAVNIKRSQVMIKTEFQQKLILNTLLISLITLNVVVMAAFLLDDMFGSDDSIYNVFNISLVVLEILAVIIVYFLVRRVSFHIAGPVYAIERTLGFMKEGDLAQRLKLRPGDQFGEVSEAINGVISTYQERISRAQEILDGNAEPTPDQLQQLRSELQWFVTSRDEVS
jgi:methyl-accepting chemotaxis protein